MKSSLSALLTSALLYLLAGNLAFAGDGRFADFICRDFVITFEGRPASVSPSRRLTARTALVDFAHFRVQIKDLISTVASEGGIVRFRLPGKRFYLNAVTTETWEAFRDRLPDLKWHLLDLDTLPYVSLNVFENWADDVIHQTHRLAFNVDGAPAVVLVTKAELDLLNAFMRNASQNAYRLRKKSGLAGAPLNELPFGHFALYLSIFSSKDPVVLRQMLGPNLLAARAADVQARPLGWLLDLYVQATGYALDDAHIDQISRYRTDLNPPPEILSLQTMVFHRRQGRLQTGVATSRQRIVLVTPNGVEPGPRDKSLDDWLLLPFR